MATNDEIIEEWKDCWKKPVKVQYKNITETVEIETREGKLYGYAGKDVLLKGIKGEVYPCKIDIFNATYTTTQPLSEEEIRADEQAKTNQAVRKNLTRLVEDLQEEDKIKGGWAITGEWKGAKKALASLDEMMK